MEQIRTTAQARAGTAGDMPRIVILGAGPTGLAAGYRLRELGYENFLLLEARDKVGGLASSETSPNGFTYDIGGHVLFSHYEYFDRLFDTLLGDEYQLLLRESWVWMCDRFLPYPFQNNIRYLPKDVVLECLMGLIEAQKQPLDLARFHNFEELIYGVFGRGIARHFMMPYNFKVWAHPPRMMNKEWIGERVSVVDIARVLGNVVLDRDDAGWGPNSTFKYPRHGGTGGLFARMQPYVQDQLRLNTPVAGVDMVRKEVLLQDGTTEPYDILLSTMPVDLLVRSIQGDVPSEVTHQAARLRHSGSHIVGVGLQQPSPSKKSWMYFPRGQLAVLPGHLPLELLTGGGAGREPPVLAARRDLALRVQARQPRHGDRRDDPGDDQHAPARRGRPRRHRGYDADRARLHLPDALGGARPGAGGSASVAGEPGHLFARPLRRVALRSRQHGPLGGAGRRVGQPDRPGGAGRGTDVPGEERVLTDY